MNGKLLGFRRNGCPIWQVQGGAPTRLEEIDKRCTEIDAEIKRLEALPDPEGDEASRSQALEDRAGVMDELLDEFEALETERKPLADREARRARVLAAIQSQDTDRVSSGNADQGNGYNGRSGGAGGRRTDPSVINRVHTDPYADLQAVRSLKLAPNDLISRGLDAVEQAPDYMPDDHRENVTRLIQRSGRKQGALIARHCLLTGSDEYREAFQDYMEDPTNLQRAALSLTNANGGYLVPFTLDPSIILTNSGSANPFRQISNIKTTATNTWNGVSSAGMNAAWLAEGAIATDNSPTFANIQITPQKAAAWVFGSYEILEDSDFESQVPVMLGDAKDRLEEAAFCTGTGTGQPKGIFVAATTNVTGGGATGTGLVVADLYSTQAAVPPRFRRNSSWVMSLSMINKARGFDTAGGSSYWTNLGQGQPEQLLGGALYESSTVAAYVVTAGTEVAVYGDFNQYAIVDRIGMSVLYEPIVKGTGGILPSGQGGWFAFWRVGADALVPGAFRVLVTP